MTSFRKIAHLWIGAGLVCSAAAFGQEATNSAGGGGTQTEVRVVTSKRMSMIDLLLQGGPVMYPLALCSVVMVAVTLERFLTLRRSKILAPDTRLRVQSAATTLPGSLNATRLLSELEPRPDLLARIAVAALRKAGRPVQEIEKAVEDAGAKAVLKLQRNNRLLSSVAGVAPLLGLLGTVTGIIRTFMTVSAQAEALGRTEVLAGGIYEALVATAVGLGIAILSLVLYYVFQERVDRLATEVEESVTGLVETLGANP
jgi:biopolymer transport protein ExbB